MSEEKRFTLPQDQARVLNTTHKTRPQMEAISSRSLLKVLPWVNVTGAFYRVNRRLVLEIRPGMITFIDNGTDPVTILGSTLDAIPVLKHVPDKSILDTIAGSAVKVEFSAGDPIVSNGDTPSHIYLIFKGKVSFHEPGTFVENNALGNMGSGHHFGEFGLFPDPPNFAYNAVAVTDVTLFKISYVDILTLFAASDHIDNHIDALDIKDKVNRKGESIVELYNGLHNDEPDIPSSYVAYDPKPKEIGLHTGQTILKIHTKIADLYNNPHNQTEEQVRLTIEELRESQEDELINNKDFGLLNSVAHNQRIQTKNGPPTPDDLDELLSKRRKTKYLFAHPKAVAAFLRECNKKSIYPDTIEMDGRQIPAWRGCPILTCNKIPVVNGVTSILAMRVGEEDQGVVGLHQMGIPEEVEPSLSVRYMGINEKAIISYLITNYYSVAILTPDALGVLENVEVGIH